MCITYYPAFLYTLLFRTEHNPGVLLSDGCGQVHVRYFFPARIHHKLVVSLFHCHKMYGVDRNSFNISVCFVCVRLHLHDRNGRSCMRVAVFSARDYFSSQTYACFRR